MKNRLIICSIIIFRENNSYFGFKIQENQRKSKKIKETPTMKTIDVLVTFLKRENYKNTVRIGIVVGIPVVIILSYFAMIQFGIFMTHTFNDKYDYESGQCSGYFLCGKHIGAMCSGASNSNYFFGCFMLSFIILGLGVLACFGVIVIMISVIDNLKPIFIHVENYLKNEWLQSRTETIVSHTHEQNVKCSKDD